MSLGRTTPDAIARDRQWRQQAAKRYAEKQAARTLERAATPRTPPKPRPRAARRKARRNDAPWAKECAQTYGTVCIVPGCGSRRIEWDHIKPRAQGGKSVVENGIPLCGAWSETLPAGHHGAKTAGTLKFDPAWLTDTQRAYLAGIRWVDWDADGQPYGEGWRHFTERTTP